MRANIYAGVLIEQNKKFLLVQENKSEFPWYLPAGRVEAGEQLLEAALRETLEEAGVNATINGVLKIDVFPRSEDTYYLKVIFTGSIPEGTPLKDKADEHSIRSQWFTLEEARKLNLRSDEVTDCIERFLAGDIHSLSVISHL